MNVRQRVERIHEEIDGVVSQYGVDQWERNFLDSIVDRGSLSERQEQKLADIERKVFGHGGWPSSDPQDSITND